MVQGIKLSNKTEKDITTDRKLEHFSLSSHVADKPITEYCFKVLIEDILKLRRNGK